MAVVKNIFNYDNSLDVFGIHCVGGIVGAIGTGILVNPGIRWRWYRRLFDGRLRRRLCRCHDPGPCQAKGVLVTLLWSGIGSAILYKIVDLVVGLRATPRRRA